MGCAQAHHARFISQGEHKQTIAVISHLAKPVAEALAGLFNTPVPCCGTMQRTDRTGQPNNHAQTTVDWQLPLMNSEASPSSLDAIEAENARLRRQVAELSKALDEAQSRSVLQSEKNREALYRISETSHSSKDLQDIFRRIHTIIGELLPAENFFIALHDAETDMVSFPYYVDQFDQPIGGERRPAFQAERIFHAARVFDMGAVQLAGALADPQHVGRGVVPVAGR